MGNRTRVKVVKNKVAPPFKEAEFDIMFGQGISKVGEILDIGAKMGVVQKSGSWFGYGDIRLGQGRDNVKEYFLQNPQLAKEIEGKVFAKLAEESKKTMGRLTPVKPPVENNVQETAQETAKPAARRRSANIDIDVE